MKRKKRGLRCRPGFKEIKADWEGKNSAVDGETAKGGEGAALL